MALELEQFGSGVRIPHPRGGVARAGDDAAPVRRYRHAPDTAVVSLELEQLGARAGVPHPRGFVIRAGDDAAPVRRYRHTPDGVGVTKHGQFVQIIDRI